MAATTRHEENNQMLLLVGISIDHSVLNKLCVVFELWWSNLIVVEVAVHKNIDETRLLELLLFTYFLILILLLNNLRIFSFYTEVSKI